jgi:hypothetical protein
MAKINQAIFRIADFQRFSSTPEGESLKNQRFQTLLFAPQPQKMGERLDR